jgi:hypothetical protein
VSFQAVQNVEQLVTVAARAHSGRVRSDLVRADPSQPEGDLLWSGDRIPLPLLESSHELAGFEEALGRPGVEPSDPAAQPLDAQRPVLKIAAVQVGDFQFTSR